MANLSIQNNQACRGKVGFIQAPQESDDAFAQRVALSLSKPYMSADGYLYGWIPIVYSNKGLSFLEAGATWVEYYEGIPYPIIQLKRGFKNKEKWLFYKKDEVLKHELVHAYRIAFEEPKFEEFIAYATSKYKFRRLLGPIFQNQKETYFFLLSTTLVMLIPALYSLFITLGLTAFFGGRLIVRRKKFLYLIKKYHLGLPDLIKISDREFLSGELLKSFKSR